MARGHADWGNAAALTYVSSISDLGELAARLKSVDVYDRSGNVIFLTSFDDGLGEVIVQLEGTGAEVVPVLSPTYGGSASVRLTGGSDGLLSAGFIKRVKPISVTNLGIELAFSLGANLSYLMAMVQYNTGSQVYKFAVYFMAADDQIRVRISDSETQVVGSYSFGAPDDDLWHIAKMVIDLDNLAYIRLLLNDSAYDLASYSPTPTVDATVRRFEPYILAKSTSGNNGIAHVDNLILTINEPN